MTELKPCQCGSWSLIVQQADIDTWAVTCTDCSNEVFGLSKAGAIAAWNTPSPRDQLIAATGDMRGDDPRYGKIHADGSRSAASTQERMMSETLPREIPTDPADQFEQMPEWAFKAAWARSDHTGPIPLRCRWKQRFPIVFAVALALWEFMPEPVNPDCALADEVWHNHFGSPLNHNSPGFRAMLEMARRVREAKP